jgi:hypothetical protein
MNTDFPNDDVAYIMAAVGGFTGRRRRRRIMPDLNDGSTYVAAIRATYPLRAADLIHEARAVAAETGVSVDHAARDIFRRENARK